VSEQPDWPAFAGIDWGGAQHQLCVVDLTGKRRTQLRVKHNVAGLSALDADCTAAGPDYPSRLNAPKDCSSSTCRQPDTCCSRCHQGSRRARERYKVAAIKDDRFDAFVLADTLRHEHQRWWPLPIPSPLLAEIRAHVPVA